MKAIGTSSGIQDARNPPMGTDPAFKIPSCPIKASDEIASIEATGRRDDGSNETLVYAVIAGRADLAGIRKINSIPTERLSFALKDGEE